LEELRMIMMSLAMGQLLSETIKRGGAGGDGGFMVVEGAYDGGAWRDGGLGKQFQGAVDPSFQVRVPSFFESQQAVGEVVPAGGGGEIVAKVVMRIELLVIGQVGVIQRHICADWLRKLKYDFRSHLYLEKS
jgi:hypothetical protein